MPHIFVKFQADLNLSSALALTDEMVVAAVGAAFVVVAARPCTIELVNAHIKKLL
jgi:hypothetical protein